MELNTKQELFCLEYLKDFNGTQAAIRAGYSAKTAGVIASEHLTKPNIATRISELVEARGQRLKIDADWVLKNAAESFEFNAGKTIGKDGEQMVNANAAARFLELVGKHAKVKAFEGNDTHEGIAQPVKVIIDVQDCRISHSEA